ncbi:MAG: ABC transporter permease [Candidatus Zixiibacteriota bacterium]
MSKILTLAIKDLRLLLRDKASLFWVIMFPLLIALFFGTIFSGSGGGMGGMKIAVVDEDRTDYSRAYIGKLDAMDVLEVTPMAFDSAYQKVRTGKYSAYMLLKKGFGETSGMFADSPMVEVGLDPSRRAEAGYLQGMLTQAAFALMHDRYASPEIIREEIDALISDSGSWSGLNPGQRDHARAFLGSMADFFESLEPADTAGGDSAKAGGGMTNMFPVRITSVTNDKSMPRSAFEVTFPSAVLWGLIGVAATFAVGIVKERNGGTYLRLRLAPVSRAHILAGKGLACFIGCFSIALLLILVGTLIFGVRVVNPGILLVSLVATCLCFVGVTMMVSVMGKTEEAVGGASWGILLVMSMIGGGMLPLMFMPGWLKTISHISPVKWGILSIEGGIWRGFTYSEIIFPVAVLLGIGSVCFAVGVTLINRSER